MLGDHLPLATLNIRDYADFVEHEGLELVQRRVSATGTIMVAVQLLAVGRTYARTVVTVHVADTTLTVEFADDDQRTMSRTTDKPVRSWKAFRPRKDTHVS